MLEAVMAYQSLIIVLVIAVLVIVILTTGYIKAPPDTAYIISGLRKKIIIGKASIKIPFFERMDRLSLKLIPIDVKTSTAVPTADYINIQVDAAVNIKISSDNQRLSVAAENFLNQDTDYIARVAREVLEGNMREIVGRMKLEEMVSDRQKFAELVKENAMPDLAAMGLDIISFNVQNFSDSNGVIDDLGIDNISDQEESRDCQAEADKEIAVAKAEADRQPATHGSMPNGKLRLKTMSWKSRRQN
ncbi:MAG: flotillin family protein [Holdemania massiliensis]